MLGFHFMNAIPIGPLGNETMRSNIYAWPIFNPCGVDRDVIKLNSGTPVVVHDLPINRRGMVALEYLIFEPRLQSQCNPTAFPNAEDWNSLSDLEKKNQRYALARLIVVDIQQKATLMAEQWNVNGSNYTKSLIDGSAFSSVQDSVQALSDALFSIEKTKDVRLAKPLGLHVDCFSETGSCPELAEHTWSGLGVSAILAATEGFSGGFFGAMPNIVHGFGFDDYLKTKGRESIAKDIRSALARLQSTAEVFDSKQTLQTMIAEMDPTQCKATTVTNRIVPICAVFQDIREISTTMKIDMLATLSLAAPASVQGDND